MKGYRSDEIEEFLFNDGQTDGNPLELALLALRKSETQNCFQSDEVVRCVIDVVKIARQKGNSMEQEEETVCICREPSCSGCDCGSDCAFVPGHDNGTKAITPLEALIEAVEKHLSVIADAEEDSNKYTDVLHDDVRRLYATIAWTKRQQGTRNC